MGPFAKRRSALGARVACWKSLGEGRMVCVCVCVYVYKVCVCNGLYRKGVEPTTWWLQLLGGK